jgi:hypothetical protein
MTAASSALAIRAVLMVMLGAAALVEVFTPVQVKQNSGLALLVNRAPRVLRSHVWGTLPAGQILVAALLASDWSVRFGAIFGAIFFGVGIIYLVWLLREHPGKSCGCFGSGRPASIRSVVRNVTLLAACTWLVLCPGRWTSASWWTLIVAMTLAVCGSIAFVEPATVKRDGRGTGAILSALLRTASHLAFLRRRRRIVEFMDSAIIWKELKAFGFEVEQRVVDDEWRDQSVWVFVFHIPHRRYMRGLTLVVTADVALRSPWLRVAVVENRDDGEETATIVWESRNLEVNRMVLGRVTLQADDAPRALPRTP